MEEKLFSILSVIDSETGLFTHDLSYVDKTGLSIRKTSSISWAFSGKNSDEANMLIRQCLLSHGDFVWLGSAFGVRRSRCDIDNFIKFVSPRPDIKYCYQDWPLAVWIAAMPNSKFKYIDKKLFKYRIHDKNYSSSAPNLGDRRRNIYKSYSTYLLIYDILTYKNMDINYIKKANFMVKRHKLLLILLEGSTRTAFSFMVKNYKVIFSEDLSLNFFIKYSLYFILGPNLASYVIYRMGGFSRAIHSS